MNLKPPDWVEELRASLNREFDEGPQIAAMATVDASRSPQVRSIVLRELASDGSIWFVTDGRSAKIGQLAENAAVQLLIWMPQQRVQYRLTGEAHRIVEEEILIAQWGKLSEATKAMFFWGTAMESEWGIAKTQAIPPVNFAAYRIWVSGVDYLSLLTTPHTRWIAREADGWERRRTRA